jgi:hypothetical protein
MTPDDTPVPNDDPVARAARRGLGEIAGSGAPGELSWVAVQSGARRIRQRRLAALVAACAIVVVAATAALAAGRNDADHVRVAGVPTTSSTTTPTTASTSTTTAPTTAPTSTSTTTTTTPQQGDKTRWLVTRTGGVGQLQLGASTEAEVRADAGAPDATGRSTFEVPSRPDFNAFGYDCSDQAAPDRISLHPYPQTSGPYCRTVFYLNVDTGTLAAFSTTSNRYETENGVAVGTSAAEAEQREGRAPVSGCFQGIALGDLATDPYEVFIWVGAQPTDSVSSLSAEAASNQVGRMFC